MSFQAPKKHRPRRTRGLWLWLIQFAFIRCSLCHCRFTSVSRFDCFMNLRGQYSRMGKPCEVVAFRN